MMVNLGELKQDWTVYFKCGGNAIVEHINDDSRVGASYIYGISFKEYTKQRNFAEFERYQVGGTLHGTSATSPFDIVKIEPPMFNWDDIKVGMAFLISKKTDEPFYYLCRHPTGNVHKYLGRLDLNNHFYNVECFNKRWLIRYPKYDIDLRK